eukprot:Awhi_evm1s3715
MKTVVPDEIIHSAFLIQLSESIESHNTYSNSEFGVGSDHTSLLSSSKSIALSSDSSAFLNFCSQPTSA